MAGVIRIMVNQQWRGTHQGRQQQTATSEKSQQKADEKRGYSVPRNKYHWYLPDRTDLPGAPSQSPACGHLSGYRYVCEYSSAHRKDHQPRIRDDQQGTATVTQHTLSLSVTGLNAGLMQLYGRTGPSVNFVAYHQQQHSQGAMQGPLVKTIKQRIKKPRQFSLKGKVLAQVSHNIANR